MYFCYAKLKIECTFPDNRQLTSLFKLYLAVYLHMSQASVNFGNIHSKCIWCNNRDFFGYSQMIDAKSSANYIHTIDIIRKRNQQLFVLFIFIEIQSAF